MRKEAYYFSHDANAQDDPKIMKMIDNMGWEAYGIYWAIIEKLRQEKTYMLSLSVCNALAKRWAFDAKKLEEIINRYELFKIRKNYFWSQRLKDSMEKKTELARASALIRWNNTEAMPKHNGSNANGMRNDAIKVKEKESKKSNTDSFAKNGKIQANEAPDYTNTTKWAKNLIGEGYSRLLTPEERKKAELEWENKNK